jgi:hypothetical protein
MIVLTTSAEQTFSIIPIRQTNGVKELVMEFTNETTKEVFTRLATFKSSSSDILEIGISSVQDTIDYFKLRILNDIGNFEAEICLKTLLNQLNILQPNEHLSFLVQDNFYNLKVYFENTTDVIYKDRIFCTNQSTAIYSINNLEYTLPNIDNNDYITI